MTEYADSSSDTTGGLAGNFSWCTSGKGPRSRRSHFVVYVDSDAPRLCPRTCAAGPFWRCGEISTYDLELSMRGDRLLTQREPGRCRTLDEKLQIGRQCGAGQNRAIALQTYARSRRYRAVKPSFMEEE